MDSLVLEVQKLTAELSQPQSKVQAPSGNRLPRIYCGMTLISPAFTFKLSIQDNRWKESTGGVLIIATKGTHQTLAALDQTQIRIVMLDLF